VRRTPHERPRTKPASKPRRVERPPARREEVLEAALALIAERGVRGASLRALAAELGMSQPSLYHYFPSKSAMVNAIVEHSAEHMLTTGLSLPLPKTPAELPRFVRDATWLLYQTESHPRFVRFLFAVAIEGADNRAIIAKVFAERLDPSFGMLVRTLTSDPRHRAELEQLSKMIVYSLGFMLLEDRALLERPKPTQRTLDYADWVVGAAADVLAARIGAVVVAKADDPSALSATPSLEKEAHTKASKRRGDRKTR
jgi:AcrR family transcriptional regulator